MSRNRALDDAPLQYLYEVERLTLRQIAERYGVSPQAVHKRLTEAGIEMRPSFRTCLTWAASGTDLRSAEKAIAQALEYLKIEGSKRGPRSLHNYIMRNLQPGAAVIIPRPKMKSLSPTLHRAAKRLGIRISIRSIDRTHVRITRIG